MELIEKVLNKIVNSVYGYIGTLLILIIASYREFIFGGRAFLSNNDAMDMYDQIYPSYINIAQNIAKGLYNTLYCDLSIAYGTNRNILFNFLAFPAFFGEENIVYLLLVRILLLIFLSGLFFYLFSYEYTNNRIISFIAGISYAFCGNIIVRQYWESYPYEVLKMALFLFAFELIYKKKKCFIFFILVEYFIYSNSSIYFRILYFALTCAYIISRMYLNVNKLKNCLLAFTIFLIVFFYINTPFQIINNVNSVVNTKRFQQSAVTTNVTSTNTIADSAEKNSLTSIIAEELELDTFYDLINRSVGTNTPNSRHEYKGTKQNYLNDIVTYCGIISILIIIPGILKIDKKKRNVLLFYLIVALVYIFVTKVRYIANGFSYDTFKLSSFWITILILVAFLDSAEIVFNDQSARSNRIIVVESLFLCIILSFNLMRGYLEKDQFFISIFFIIFYLSLFMLKYKNKILVYNFKYAIALIVCVEAFMQMFIALRSFNTMQYAELKSRTLYNDYTLEALDWLKKENNEIDNYRIDKQYYSFRYNDAWAQDYNGTSFYIGGTGANRYLLDLCSKLKFATESEAYNYCHTPSLRLAYNTLVGVKYILSNSSTIANYGYSKVYEENGISIYENNYYLPLVIGFDKYINEEDINNVAVENISDTMMAACVVDDLSIDDINDYNITLGETCDYNSYLSISNIYKDNEVSCIYDEENDCYNLEYPLPDGMTAVFFVDYQDGFSMSTGYITYYLENGDSSTIYREYLTDQQDYQNIAITAEKLDKIKITNIYNVDIDKINDIKVYYIESEDYYKHYKENVENIKLLSPNIVSFNEQEIICESNNENDTIMCLTIPYGNWNVYIDGTKTSTFIANIAFTGFVVPKGKHEIVLKVN